MSNRVQVKYVGPHDEVEIIDGQVELVVKHGESIEVSHDLARGVQGEDDSNEGALGGLLDQPDNWELVKPASKAAEKENAE